MTMDDEWPNVSLDGDEVDDSEDDAATESRHQSEMETKLKQRHYKKDSRFLLDLYTLTFDDNQTLDEIGTCKTRVVSTGDNDFVRSVSPQSQDRPLYGKTNRSISSGAIFELGHQSLNLELTHQQSKYFKTARSGSIPSLETNLLKILARKIQDSEEISFRKVKLLTKAYYRMLRSDCETVISLNPVSLDFPEYSSFVVTSNKTALTNLKPIAHSQSRLSWQKLVQSSPPDLSRMVAGLENTAKVLNDYLMDVLLEKDELVSKQDEMLEEISELADHLLPYENAKTSTFRI